MKHQEWWIVVLLGCALPACASSRPASEGSQEQPDAYGASYEGDGVQCGSIICSGSQQCCLVYVAPDASNSNPSHKCDQYCVSECADTCPDSGAMTGGNPPPAGGPGGGTPGAPSPGGMHDGGMPMMPGPGGPANDAGPPPQDAAAE